MTIRIEVNPVSELKLETVEQDGNVVVDWIPARVRGYSAGTSLAATAKTYVTLEPIADPGARPTPLTHRDAVFQSDADEDGDWLSAEHLDNPVSLQFTVKNDDDYMSAYVNRVDVMTLANALVEWLQSTTDSDPS